jgi:hypothetical protein
LAVVDVVRIGAGTAALAGAAPTTPKRVATSDTPTATVPITNRRIILPAVVVSPRLLPE